MPAEVAVRLEQPGRHRLSFRAADLAERLGACVDCGARVDIETWLTTRCPGVPAGAGTELLG